MIGLRIALLLDPLVPSPAVIWGWHLAHWLRAAGHDVVVVTAGGDLTQQFEAARIQLIRQASGLRGWFGGRSALVHELQGWQPDVLHVHQCPPLRLARSLADSLGVPLMASVHGLITPREGRGLANPLVRVVTAPSAAHRAHLCGRVGLAPDRVPVVPYGLDLANLTERPWRFGPWTVATVGSAVIDRQSLRWFCQALGRVRASGHDLRGMIILELGPAPATEALIAEAGLGSALDVRILDTDWLPHLLQADLFVHPAPADEDSLVLTEAMALGLPVIAGRSRLPGAIQDGITGLLVESGDAELLAQALQGLLADPAQARSLGQAARQQVREQQDLAVVGTLLLDLYRHLAGTGGGDLAQETHRTYRSLIGQAEEGPSGSRSGTGRFPRST